MSIFKLIRQESRENINVPFYQYTDDDNQVFNSFPYFIEKSEILSEDGLVLTKEWKYLIDDSWERLEEIYSNIPLNNLNQKIYQYCLDNNITRHELKGYIIVDGSELEIATFTNKL